MRGITRRRHVPDNRAGRLAEGAGGQPLPSTVAAVGTFDGTLSGVSGDDHRVSTLMKRGNTSAFGKHEVNRDQVNYVNIESVTCAAGVEVPLTRRWAVPVAP